MESFLVNTLVFRSILRATKNEVAVVLCSPSNLMLPHCAIPFRRWLLPLRFSSSTPHPTANCIIKKSKLEVFCISSFRGFFHWHIYNWQLKLDIILKSVTEVLCLSLCPRLVMVWNQLEYTVIVIQRVYPRTSCFTGEDWVSIWNQQINPRQVSERASLIGSSYWALNHDKMLLPFPCKLAGNIWYFLHKSPIAVPEIYSSSHQKDDSLSVPIITCHWTWFESVCVHACGFTIAGMFSDTNREIIHCSDRIYNATQINIMVSNLLTFKHKNFKWTFQRSKNDA